MRKVKLIKLGLHETQDIFEFQEPRAFVTIYNWYDQPYLSDICYKGYKEANYLKGEK